MCNLCFVLLVQETNTPQDDIELAQWHHKYQAWCLVYGVQLGTISSSIGLILDKFYQKENANNRYR